MVLESFLTKLILPRWRAVQPDPTPWPVYYHKRLESVGLSRYLEIKQKTRGTTLDAVIEVTPPGGRILEAGCGTSVLSILLNRKGYQNHCIDIDPEMLKIARTLNSKAKTNIEYSLADLHCLQFDPDSFDTIFSHGVFEHFSELEVKKAIDEGLRVAKSYVFSIPTIFNWANDLHGDENPWTFFYWKKLIDTSKGCIYRAYAMYSRRPIREAINKIFNSRLTWIAPNVVFVVKPKNKKLSL